MPVHLLDELWEWVQRGPSEDVATPEADHQFGENWICDRPKIVV